MMECRTARLLLSFHRPKTPELEACAVASLNDHLADCSECESFARAEHQIDRQLALAMQHVSVPADLRQRLLTQLQAERRTWYRRLPHRHPRVAAAVAVLLLFVAGLAVAAVTRPPRPLDLTAIADNWNARVPASSEAVQKFFEHHGFKVVVPPEFDYQYLDWYELQEFAGKSVPHLRFVRGQNYASVYILSASQFDVRAAADQPREGSGRFTVELRLGPANSNVAYLIKYTGGSLDGFLEEKKRSTT
jgi:hypothetical protein